MRVANTQALKALKDAGGGMSDSISRQLEAALSEDSVSPSRPARNSKQSGRSSGKPRVSGESKGEASVRLALLDAFGDWFNGGEVVQEVIPFPDRRYRVDFSLVRYRAYIEVLLTPADILIQIQQTCYASMHTGMNLVAIEL